MILDQGINQHLNVHGFPSVGGNTHSQQEQEEEATPGEERRNSGTPALRVLFVYAMVFNARRQRRRSADALLCFAEITRDWYLPKCKKYAKKNSKNVLELQRSNFSFFVHDE